MHGQQNIKILTCSILLGMSGAATVLSKCPFVFFLDG